jgi:hypothetical protein
VSAHTLCGIVAALVAELAEERRLPVLYGAAGGGCYKPKLLAHLMSD